jgi:type II secretory pathway component PulF
MKIVHALVIAFALCCIAIILFAAGAAADRNRAQAVEAAPIETGNRARCAAIYDFAAQIMRTRQAGVPLGEALAVTDDELTQDMVAEAWRQPLTLTPDGKDAMVDFFATGQYDECMDGAL